MELAITERSSDGFVEVTTRHKGESIAWQTKFYAKVKLATPRAVEEVFLGINEYLKVLPEPTQDMIFECYANIREVMNETEDGDVLLEQTKEEVQRLYKMIVMEHLYRWMMTHYNVYVPDLKDSVSDTDRYSDRDETYIKSDYYELLAFCIGVRLMIPIWGEYIARGGSGHGGDQYKEQDAISLLRGTELMSWPAPGIEGSQPVREKLMRYFEIKTAKVTTPMADLFNGNGDVNIPYRLLALVVLRRLTIVSLSDHNAKKHIISNIHHYADQQLSPNDKRIGAVSPKLKEREGRDEDDKTSVTEQYKIKHRVSDGDVAAFEVDASRMAIQAQTVDPTFDLVLLEITSSQLPRLNTMIASEHQITLAQWALAKSFPPDAFDDVNVKAINELIVTAQALYWHWGLFDIAALMTVERMTLSDGGSAGITPIPKPTSRFKPDVIEGLMGMFPHFFPQSGKEAKDIKGNVGHIGITAVMQAVSGVSWHYLGPAELYRLTSYPTGKRYIIAQAGIRQALYDAVTKIVSLNQ